jgi:hypothetical protein
VLFSGRHGEAWTRIRIVKGGREQGC